MARFGMCAALVLLILPGGGCVTVVSSRGASGQGPVPGDSAVEHGPNCETLQAARSMTSDIFKSDVLEPVAARRDLTTHEQIHLVDVVIHDFSSDIFRKDVLVLLARNPALSPEGRAYLVDNLKGMSSDIFRSDVVEALQEERAPRTK